VTSPTSIGYIDPADGGSRLSDKSLIRALGATLLVAAFFGNTAAAGFCDESGAAVARSGSDSIPVKERIEIFEEVWKTVNERYYDPGFNGVNWREVRDRYHPQVERAGSDEDFYRLLKQMVGELRDAHTRFATPEERREREREQAVSAGFSIFEVEGKPAVVSVEPDSEAARAGIQPGMIVVAIDGTPVAQRLAEARARVAGSSSDRALSLRIYRMIIDGNPGTTFRITLARDDGSTHEASLTRRLVRDAAVVTSRPLASGLGYIRLTLWKSPVRRQFKKALKQMRNVPGLIIDVRGNPGGEAEEVVKIASYFFNSHVPFGKFSNRSGRAIYLRTGDDEEVYKGPLAILINEGSGSGSELFAGVMQEMGRAIIVGRRSCGCVLGISKFRKFGDGELAVSEYGYLSPGGKTFEGVGVIPDREVGLTLADLRANRDPALEEAEKLLRALGSASGAAEEIQSRLTRFTGIIARARMAASL
jgi:carboxyl-terminal processing protease